MSQEEPFEKNLINILSIANAGLKKNEYDLDLKDQIAQIENQTLKTEMITFQKRLRNISKQQMRLQSVFANMREGIVTVGSSNSVQFYNGRALEIMNIYDENYFGLSINKIKGLEPLIEMMDQSNEQSDMVEKEFKYLVEGRKKVVNVRCSHMNKPSRGFIFVLQDISELRYLEKVRRDFVANVSHEIKTPLTSIKGFIETLLNGAIEDKKYRKKFLTKISDSADRLMLLVKDILDLAKLESQNEQLDLVEVSWLPAILSVLSEHEEKIQKLDVTFEFNRDLGDQTVMANHSSLIQVLDNLMTNAIRYIPENGTIKVDFTQTEKELTVTFCDNGSGIPQKALSRIFERFYLVEKARPSDVGGTGLGLSIVKHLVQAMNGEISVESEVGVGTTFYITLKKSS